MQKHSVGTNPYERSSGEHRYFINPLVKTGGGNARRSLANGEIQQPLVFDPPGNISAQSELPEKHFKPKRSAR